MKIPVSTIRCQIALFFLLLLSFTISNSIKAQNIVEIGLCAGWPGTHVVSSLAPSDAVPYNYNDKSVHLH